MGKCQSRSSERLERLAQAVMDHAECELAIKHLKKVCGEPAPEMEHRPSNVDSMGKLAELLGAIDAIAQQVPIVFPVHPRTQQRLSQSGIKHHPQLRLIPPLGYLDFLCLLSKATLVLTDSGGIQEETTALGVPCLTLRENTERPVTVTQGTNLLVGTNPSKIVAAAEQILRGDGRRGRTPPLWDGHAAERIVEILVGAGLRA